MENTILVAKILGPIFITIGLSIAFNKKFYMKMMDRVNEEVLGLYFAGLFGLVLGLLILNVNNSFNSTMETIITIVGYIITIKSGLVMIFPKIVKTITKNISPKWAIINASAILEILIGLYLTINSYFM